MTFPFKFRTEPGARSTPSHAPCVRVTFKDVCIAITDNEADAQEYMKTFGHLAEWRRRRNIGDFIDWDQSLPARPQLEDADPAFIA